jgi:MoxR-like ATPase
VKPADGFNVVATANTKGQGSEDGKFIGTNVLNEAFLERFPITFEQKYPSVKIEEKILIKTLEKSGKKDAAFCKKLVTWADVIRKTFFDGGVDEIISTRRLVHIVQAFTIFKDKIKAIEVCTNRFDEDTKNSFVELYTKVDGGATADSIAEDQRKAEVAAQVKEDKESESEDADESDNDTSAHI